MMNAKMILVAGATILSLALGSAGISAVLPDEAVAEEAVGPAEAADDAGIPQRFRARAYGAIEAIEGRTLTVSTPVGPVDFVTDVNTLFFADKERVTLGDFAVGDTVGAVGWWEEGGGVFHAFAVAKLAEDRLFPIAGTLAEIDGDTLTIETKGGLLATVHVDDETKYRIRGVEEPGLDDLEVGMRVIARGTLNPDGSLQAQVVGAAKAGPRQARLRGEVVAIEGDTLTVRTQRGREIVVQTDDATEFRVPGVENPTIADLKVGDKVAGEGVMEEGGTARATLVVVLPEDVARLTGKVTGIDGATLVVETASGTVNVLTDDDTIFHIRGVEEPGLDDIDVGDRIVAGGSWEDESTFHAIGVGVVGGRRTGARGAVRGRVISVGGDSFVVGAARGPVTVLVDEKTEFRVPGVEDAGLDDIEEGAGVGVGGTWNEDGTLQASVVRVGGGK
jgi:endonuclease YncB( thermonuclease family)